MKKPETGPCNNVKKGVSHWSLLGLLLFLFFMGCGNMVSQDMLYGTWSGKTISEKMVITFNRDATCEILHSGDGSKSTRITGDFEIDLSKRPICLTIRNIPQLNHPLHTIIEFRGADTMRMAEFAPRWRLRPVAFNRNTEIIFKKE